MLIEVLSNHPAVLVREAVVALDEQNRLMAEHDQQVTLLRERRRTARKWWQILRMLSDHQEIRALRVRRPVVDPGLQSALASRQAGMAAEDRAVHELSLLPDTWRLFRGYANRRGEVDILLVGPQGIWAVEVKGRAVLVHVDGERWTFEKFDRYGNRVDQGILQDRRGRSWGRQVEDISHELEKFLASRGLHVPVHPAVAVVNDRAGLGICHDPTVILSIGTDYLLAAIREAPVTLDPAARDRAAALVRRDHVFHSNRRRTRE
ncbi:nuclease-related domain-containing protein [Streptomyces sp. NPDC088726]|uniref:nuclease-related domain-containing protein n=1 Tax=Streptomyces sp. NPDC088726 TaxID=3365874 RepID=UPI00380EDD76